MRSKMSPFARRVLQWYAAHGRALPWRRNADPYRVWVSEIMLQQTRVEAVVPYFARWMKRFPTLMALAGASERDVLHAWEGLGYYSRARNLRRAARIVAAQWGGELPSEVQGLRSLPGVGPYTAGAIASIAFGRNEAALDSNIRRVLSRVFNVSERADTPAGRNILLGLAASHLPPGRARDYNQALMDIGSGICLPKLPRCTGCPVESLCEARRLSVQERRPVLGPRNPKPHRLVAAAVARSKGRVLIARRASSGLLGGMWEFPNARVTTGAGRVPVTAGLIDGLRQHYGIKVRRPRRLGTIKHSYTHFRVTVEALECEIVSAVVSRDLRWIKLEDLVSYPMGKIDRQIARWLTA